MLLFFPSPYPDELLYSVFARYHAWSFNTSAEHTCFDLFGTITYATVELPANLSALCRRLSENSVVTPDLLIREHTLFPLYKPFLPDEKQQKIKNLMMKSKTGSEIARISGLVQWNLRPNRFLKYCPVCFKHDEEICGEPYWHRSHQPSGAYVCHVHNVWLRNSIIAVLEQRDRRAYHCLSDKVTQKEPSLFQEPIDGHFLEVAKSIHWLLTNDIHSQGSDDIHERYHYLLRKQGFTKNSRTIRRADLIERALEFYGETFLEKMVCQIDMNLQDNWITELLRKRRKAIHPLHHILFMHFLGAQPAEFWNLTVEYPHPFGKGPWLCLNPAASHYRQPVIEECIITRDNNTKGPLGTFHCKCGYSYTRSGPDSDEADKYRADNVISYGPEWEKEVLRLVELEGMSFRKIGKRLSVCHHTIRNHYAELKGQQVMFHESVDEEKEKKREECRHILLKAIKQHPQLSRSQIRLLAIAEFNWLYRNDRKWLLKQLPHPRSPENNFKKRVDWEKRDEYLAGKIPAAAEEIKNYTGKPIIISMLEIGKIIGFNSIKKMRIKNLPKTKAALESVVETLEDFRIRRVHYVIDQMLRNREPLSRSRIISKAGLNGRCSDHIAEEIEKALSQCNFAVPQKSLF